MSQTFDVGELYKALLSPRAAAASAIIYFASDGHLKYHIYEYRYDNYNDYVVIAPLVGKDKLVLARFVPAVGEHPGLARVGEPIKIDLNPLQLQCAVNEMLERRPIKVMSP